METKIVEVQFQHPAEQIFDLEPGSTVIDQVVTTSPPEEQPVQYDDKDQEINDQLQLVFNAAYGTFESQRMLTEGMNPQFQNRAMEVAAQFLNTALAAVNAKSQFKQAKDKIVKPTGNVNTTTNNLIMDRDDMLKMLMEQKKNAERIIDQEEQ
jgi:hypothetical protein